MKFLLLLLFLFAFATPVFSSEEPVEDWDLFLEELKELNQSDPEGHKRAIEKISRLADEGVREAQFLFGVFLINYSREKAVDLLARASAQGCSGATGLLGMADLDANRYEEGIRKLREAAAEGNVSAQFVLARELEKSRKVESYSWYFQILTKYKDTYMGPGSQIGISGLSEHLSGEEIEEARQMANARLADAPANFFCQHSSPVPLRVIETDN